MGLFLRFVGGLILCLCILGLILSVIVTFAVETKVGGLGEGLLGGVLAGIGAIIAEAVGLAIGSVLYVGGRALDYMNRGGSSARPSRRGPRHRRSYPTPIPAIPPVEPPPAAPDFGAYDAESLPATHIRPGPGGPPPGSAPHGAGVPPLVRHRARPGRHRPGNLLLVVVLAVTLGIIGIILLVSDSSDEAGPSALTDAAGASPADGQPSLEDALSRFLRASADSVQGPSSPAPGDTIGPPAAADDGDVGEEDPRDTEVESEGDPRSAGIEPRSDVPSSAGSVPKAAPFPGSPPGPVVPQPAPDAEPDLTPAFTASVLGTRTEKCYREEPYVDVSRGYPVTLMRKIPNGARVRLRIQVAAARLPEKVLAAQYRLIFARTGDTRKASYPLRGDFRAGRIMKVGDKREEHVWIEVAQDEIDMDQGVWVSKVSLKALTQMLTVEPLGVLYPDGTRRAFTTDTE